MRFGGHVNVEVDRFDYVHAFKASKVVSCRNFCQQSLLFVNLLLSSNRMAQGNTMILSCDSLPFLSGLHYSLYLYKLKYKGNKF